MVFIRLVFYSPEDGHLEVETRVEVKTISFGVVLKYRWKKSYISRSRNKINSRTKFKFNFIHFIYLKKYYIKLLKLINL